MDRLVISRKAHLILPTHRLLDAASEQAKGKNKIGSTLKGIGPTYMDKTGRNGLRVGDIEMDDFNDRYKQLKEKHQRMLASFGADEVSKEMESGWMKAIEQMRGMQLVDSEEFVHSALENDQKILAEGAQGALLDIDFGTYPFVTSSTTTAAGACTAWASLPTGSARCSAYSRPIAPVWAADPSLPNCSMKPERCSGKRAGSSAQQLEDPDAVAGSIFPLCATPSRSTG